MKIILPGTILLAALILSLPFLTPNRVGTGSEPDNFVVVSEVISGSEDPDITAPPQPDETPKPVGEVAHVEKRSPKFIMILLIVIPIAAVVLLLSVLISKRVKRGKKSDSSVVTPEAISGSDDSAVPDPLQNDKR